MRRRGMIVILSSPSGAGKTTLTRMLLQDKALDLTLSISVTTRPRRSSEVDGVHYHFIGRHQFDLMKAAGDLLESAEVHGNCYGTPREPVDADARRRARHAVRHRLAGRAAGARGAGRATSSASSSCRRRWRNCARGSTAAPRIRPRRSRSGWRTPSARSSAGASTTMSSSTTTCSAPTRASSAIIAAERVRGSRVAEGVEAFVAKLLGG